MLPRVVKGNEDSSIYSALPLVKINNPYIEKLILLVIDQRPIQRECYSKKYVVRSLAAIQSKTNLGINLFTSTEMFRVQVSLFFKYSFLMLLASVKEMVVYIKTLGNVRCSRKRTVSSSSRHHSSIATELAICEP